MGRYRQLLFLFMVHVLLHSQAAAQFYCRIIVTAPAKTNAIFVNGNFNSSQHEPPGSQIPVANQQVIISKLLAGNYQFSLNRGSAETIECDANGVPIFSHAVHLRSDTTIYCSIAAWADAYFNNSQLKDSQQFTVTMARAAYYAAINLDSSYTYASRLYELAKQLHSPAEEARALDMQGVVFTLQGNGERALQLLYQSLLIKKTLGDSAGASLTYYNIARLFQDLQDLIKAKNNYQKAVEWTPQADANRKSLPVTKTGNLFLDENKTDSALRYADAALQLNKNCVDALLLMGDIAGKKASWLQALAYYRMAFAAGLQQNEATTLPGGTAEVYKRMAQALYGGGKKDSAFYYARMAHAVALRLNNPTLIIGTGNVLVSLFRQEKKYDSAFAYQQLVGNKKDSLFTIDKEKQVHDIFFREKMRLKDAESQQDRNLALTKIYVLGGVLTLLIIAGVAYRAKLQSRFNKRIAAIEMRALRAQMNPHFIFNCLASINRYIVMSDTKTASAYLTKFSKLIRLILDNSASEFISLDAEILTLKLYLDMESLRFDNSYDYAIEADGLERTDNTGIPAMVIQPYIENAIWHGLLHKDVKGSLCVRFSKLREDVLTVEIEDNGVGRKASAALKSKDALKTKSYGMQISKDRIAIINAQYKTLCSVIITDMEDAAGNATGTKVTLQLPLIEMAAESTPVKRVP